MGTRRRSTTGARTRCATPCGRRGTTRRLGSTSSSGCSTMCARRTRSERARAGCAATTRARSSSRGTRRRATRWAPLGCLSTTRPAPPRASRGPTAPGRLRRSTACTGSTCSPGRSRTRTSGAVATTRRTASPRCSCSSERHSTGMENLKPRPRSALSGQFCWQPVSWSLPLAEPNLTDAQALYTDPAGRAKLSQQLPSHHIRY
mmetsp:Transcript_97433/g.303437  ORF Transcript_97433/g.303437 Transcript_97433/m.303437 type:complete len:204 (+) Transcript_97433:1458-2069(+)